MQKDTVERFLDGIVAAVANEDEGAFSPEPFTAIASDPVAVEMLAHLVGAASSGDDERIAQRKAELLNRLAGRTDLPEGHVNKGTGLIRG